MIAALTWAAAQDRVSVYELLRGLTPTDERRIEAAYAEWRWRAMAGERWHKVDWRTYPLPDEHVPSVEAEAVAPVSSLVPAEDAGAAEDTRDAEPIPTEGESVVAEEAIEAVETDPDVAYVMEQIMAVEEIEPEYISLDNFNLEPSEAEMREMDALIREEALAEAAEDAVPASAEIALPVVAEAEHAEPVPAEKAEVEAVAAPAPAGVALVANTAPIEQRISKLPKDATSSAFEGLLATLDRDVNIAKAVTEAVIRDHTRRHRGTAAQRAFLALLEKR